MSKYPLASQAGVTKRAIKKATANGISEESLFQFIHGDLKKIYEKLPTSSGYQSWDSSGKRYVHIEEAKFVAKHFLRNTIKPKSRKALVLSGTDPALACLPWAMSGLADEFVAYESYDLAYYFAKKDFSNEKRKIKNLVPKGREIELQLVLGNILEERSQKYGIIDLDFCNNRIRNQDYRSEILSLVDEVSPNTGPFVLRTTLHMGRANNSRRDIENHIDKFEEQLRNPTNNSLGYKIRAHDRSPYQSSLPMVSLLWILEKRREEPANAGEKE